MHTFHHPSCINNYKGSKHIPTCIINKSNQVLGFVGWVGGGMDNCGPHGCARIRPTQSSWAGAGTELGNKSSEIQNGGGGGIDNPPPRK